MRDATDAARSGPRMNGRGCTNQPWITKPALARIVRAADLAHAVRHARVEHDEPAEPRLDRADELGLLDPADARELAPHREHRVAEHDGLATAEVAAAPARQRVHERERAVRQVAVKLLPAAVDVARQPRRRDVVATELVATERDQPVVQARVQRAGEVRPRRCSQRGVLLRDVPPVPDEAVEASGSRIREPLVERRSKRLGLAAEAVDDERKGQGRRQRRRPREKRSDGAGYLPTMSPFIPPSAASSCEPGSVFSLCATLNLSSDFNQVGDERVELVLGDLHALVGIRHRLARVLARAAGRLGIWSFSFSSSEAPGFLGSANTTDLPNRLLILVSAATLPRKSWTTDLMASLPPSWS